MSDERKLHIVAPPKEDAAFDEAEPSAEEIAEAEALRAALDRGEQALAEALRAAWSPELLAASDHEALLAQALGDDPVVAPPTRLEGAAAARLAAELDSTPAGEGSAPYQLARALRVAHAPRGLDELTHERIVKRALTAASGAPAAGRSRTSAAAHEKPSVAKRRRLGVTMAALSSMVAAAAVLVLFARFSERSVSSSDQASASKAAASAAPAPMAEAPMAAATASPAESAAPAAAAAPAPMAHADGAGRRGPSVGGAKRDTKGRVGADGPRDEPPGGGRFAEAPPAQAKAPAAAPAVPRPAPAEAAEPARRATLPHETAVAGYIPVRSTDGLFGSEPFPRTGGESSRIDRIAMARASDLRENRFAAWGVR